MYLYKGNNTRVKPYIENTTGTERVKSTAPAVMDGILQIEILSGGRGNVTTHFLSDNILPTLLYELAFLYRLL